MKAGALQALTDGQQALIDALDGDDAEAVETATARLRAALAEIGSAGAWRDAPDTRDQLTRALMLGEAGRVRAGYLADRTRRRLSVLASLRRPPAVASYGRNGRFRLAGL